MKAYTVQIDDALADSLSAEAVERHTSVEALIVSAAAEMAQDFGDPLSAEQISQIEAGLADVRAGRTHSQDEVTAEVKARLGW